MEYVNTEIKYEGYIKKEIEQIEKLKKTEIISLPDLNYEESLMVKASWYYYFENMTQQAIADRLSISRMRVIKLLESARQSGIIQFRLRSDGVGVMVTES